MVIGVSSLAEVESSRAFGASLTALTVTLMVATSVVMSSVTVYINLSSPLKSGFGEYSTLPLTIFAVPLDPSETPRICRGSLPEISFSNMLMQTVPSSSTVALSSTASMACAF